MFDRTRGTNAPGRHDFSDLGYSELEYPQSDYPDLEYPTVPDQPSHRREAVGRFFLRLFTRLAWVVAAAAVALGCAGIVAATQHFPAIGGRPELTWGADQARLPELNQALLELRALSTNVAGLGDMARDARVAVQQMDQVKLDAAIRTGNAELDSIERGTASIRSLLHCGDAALAAQLDTENSPRIRDLYAQGCASLQATDSLRDDWTALVDGSLSALQTVEPIARHEQVAGDAVQLGSQGKYKQAIAKLGETAPYLASVQKSYDALSKITDVWTLGQWLERSKNMDAALRGLWQALLDSNGRVTQKVRDALVTVDKAKQALPPDTSYMSAVLQEIGTAGINEAAISIETARGRLAAAVQGIAGLSN